MVGHYRAVVHGGRLRLDEAYDAPDGTEVELTIVEDDDLTDEERGQLHADIYESMAALDRGEGVSAEQVLAELRSLTRIG
jgi:hypothetical protein